MVKLDNLVNVEKSEQTQFNRRAALRLFEKEIRIKRSLDMLPTAKFESVLDAGCGVGGSSIWLAKNFRASVIGITLSIKQLKTARSLARKNKLEHLAKFHVRDFLNTKFPEESFDVVWSIESVCHAEEKKDFLKEAFRLLKRGGKIIVSDGFLKRDAMNEREREMVRKVTNGWAFPNFDKLDRFKKSLEEVGFKNIKCWDKTQEVLPSLNRIYTMCKIAYPIAKITEKLRITSSILTKNNLAGTLIYDAMKMGLASYGVFYAEK